MAQCQAQVKKMSTSRFDLYGDIFSGHPYGIAGGNGLQKYGSDHHNERRRSSMDFSHGNLANANYGEDMVKAAAIRKIEASNNAHVIEANSGVKTGVSSDRRSPNGVAVENVAAGPAVDGCEKCRNCLRQPKEESHPATPRTPALRNRHGGETAVPPSSGRNKNSGEIPAPLPSGRNKNSGEMSTPPLSGRKNSGEFATPPASARNRAGGEVLPGEKYLKGAQPVDPGFAYGEILKDVGNLNSCEDSLKNGRTTSGDSGSSGRGRAESPKSCSSSSGGSSNGDSQSAGKIVNFGNILPSGGSFKAGSASPLLNPGAARGNRPNGVMGQSRRSNSADFPAGHLKNLHAGRSGYEGRCNGVYTGGPNAKGSISNTTSPTGSVGTGHPSPMHHSSSNIKAAGENQLIRNAIANMDAEELKNAGNEQYKKGHFSEALSMYEKAISLAPGKAPYRSNRAAALTCLGRLPEALQECIYAIRMDPGYTRAHHRLASLYLRLGQVDSARRYFKTAGPQADWGDSQRLMVVEKHLLRSKQARKSQDWNAVMREADAAIIAGADSAPQILAFKAEALLKLHRPDEADEVFANVRKVEEVLKRSSFSAINIVVLVIHAQIDMSLGRFDGAVLAAERASQYAPRDSEASEMKRRAHAVAAARKLGNDLFKAGRFSEATTAYGEGLENDAENAVLLCNRAACRAKLGQWEKAVEDCNTALEVHPTYLKALLRRAQSNFKLERLDDAFRDYELLRREMPGDVEVRRGLFDVQVALKKSKGEDVFKLKFGGEVDNVSSYEQFQEAITSPGVSIVEFSTRWSERCKLIAPCVDNLSQRYLSLNFLKVDVDDLPYLSKVENIGYVPTFKIYKNGSKVLELCGPDEQALQRAVIHYSL